jgi:glycosyltransferase involved in cell wall biosynthesis
MNTMGADGSEELANCSYRIVFITATDLPEGGGHTSRLKSVADALSRNGHRILILNEHALGIAPVSTRRPRGTVSGVPYEYVLGKVERQYGFGVLREKSQAVTSIWKRITRLHKQGEVDILWFNHLSFYDTYPLTILAKRLGIPTIQAYEDERLELVSEEPLSLARRVFALNSYLADRWCPATADAIVVISNYLVEKYSRLSRQPSKVHLIPTVIDCDLWGCGPEVVNDVPRILYSGSFGEQDDLEQLLTALSIVRQRGLQFKFIMLGGTSREGETDRQARIAAHIRQLELTGFVERRGFVPLEEVRVELSRANVLVNIRRDGVWGRAGLSTKLSEYLASGRLVIASILGDVGKYLKDGESALLVSPKCDPHEISTALMGALASADLRARIGMRGRQVALANFDIPVVQARFRSVMKSLLKRRARAIVS